MRAFNDDQRKSFLNAFGQDIQTSTGSTFTGIVEVLPFSIETGGGYIESTETYVSVQKPDITTYGIDIDSVLIIEGESYKVYNVVDDLSGIVDIYYRTVAGDSFAEDY